MAVTGDYVHKDGMRPHTRTVVSQKVKIFSYTAGQLGLTRIGAIASFAPSESRDVQEVRGIGMGDTIGELVPGYTAAVSIDVERTALYLANLWQAFGYLGGTDGLVRSLKHHQWPFDVKVEEVMSEVCKEASQGSMLGVSRSSEGSSLAIVTYYEGCWFTSMRETYGVDRNVISQSGNIKATDVTDGRKMFRIDMNTGNKLRSRLFSDIDSVNRLRNQIGEAGDVLGILR